MKRYDLTVEDVIEVIDGSDVILATVATSEGAVKLSMLTSFDGVETIAAFKVFFAGKTGVRAESPFTQDELEMAVERFNKYAANI